MFGRNKVAMLLAEFLGVATLTSVVYTIVGRTSFPLFAALAAGGTVAVFTLTVGAFSGAHLNPAISLGLWSIRKISTKHAVANIAAQFLGGLAAWTLLKYFLGHSLDSVAGATFSWKVFVAEALGTMVFAFGFASAILEKFEATKAAGVIGASLFIGILIASLASNAVVNPAVAVGIQSWSLAYATAPLLGGLVGMNVYGLVFAEESTFKMAARTVKKTTKLKKAPAKKKPVARKKK